MVLNFAISKVCRCSDQFFEKCKTISRHTGSSSSGSLWLNILQLQKSANAQISFEKCKTFSRHIGRSSGALNWLLILPSQKSAVAQISFEKRKKFSRHKGWSSGASNWSLICFLKSLEMHRSVLKSTKHSLGKTSRSSDWLCSLIGYKF